MDINFKEYKEYIIIKKTEFEKLKEGYRQYKVKKEYSKNYMRKKYHEDKQKNLLDDITEDDLFNNQIELLNFMNN